MKLQLLFILLAFIELRLGQEINHIQWKKFKRIFKKNYSSEIEETKRFNIIDNNN